MTTKYIVNNATGQTITGDITVNGNLNITGTTNTRPYKVFTSLLTQSGSDNTNTTFGDGPIVEGITYYIYTNPDNYDLTFYGAPNNNPGTFFIANQTTTLPYTNTLELSFNDGAPVATVLENTIGNIWFSYVDLGVYNVNSDGLFTTEPIPVIMPSMWNSGNNGIFVGNRVTWQNNAAITLETFSVEVGSINKNDGNLQNNFFEIRIYN